MMNEGIKPYEDSFKGEAYSALRHPIFLMLALRFVRDGALDEPGVEGWVEVVFAEGGSVGKMEDAHAVQRTERAGSKGIEEKFDLVAHLVGGQCFREGFEKGSE